MRAGIPGRKTRADNAMFLHLQATAQVGVQGLPGLAGAGRWQAGLRGVRAERPPQRRDEEGVAPGAAPLGLAACRLHSERS